MVENKQQSSLRKLIALNNVASTRATIGAKQNRLQSTIRNLDVSIENQSAARSQIKDVDYAEESANYTQQNILKQGGASVLAQSNSFQNLHWDFLDKFLCTRKGLLEALSGVLWKNMLILKYSLFEISFLEN